MREGWTQTGESARGVEQKARGSDTLTFKTKIYSHCFFVGMLHVCVCMCLLLKSHTLVSHLSHTPRYLFTSTFVFIVTNRVGVFDAYIYIYSLPSYLYIHIYIYIKLPHCLNVCTMIYYLCDRNDINIDMYILVW